jgi:predicted transcriptional regulator
MARPKPLIPTPAEQRALNFLYRHGSATVREYFEKGESVQDNAYTSVMSLLHTLFQKGLVTRTEEGRAYRYKPTAPQAQLRANVVANVLEIVFENDLDALKEAVGKLKSGKKQ